MSFTIPPFEGTLEGFTKKYLNSHGWRLQSAFEFDDLMQEAYIVYLKCKRAYEGKIDNAAWFMGLYKSSLARRVHDLSKETTVINELVPLEQSVNGDDFNLLDVLSLVQSETDGYMEILKRQMPEELRAVFSFLENAPAPLLASIENAWSGSKKRKAFGVKHLCELCGIDPNTDLISMAREHFSEA